jgi:hypothetical protein
MPSQAKLSITSVVNNARRGAITQFVIPVAVYAALATVVLCVLAGLLCNQLSRRSGVNCTASDTLAVSASNERQRISLNTERVALNNAAEVAKQQGYALEQRAKVLAEREASCDAHLVREQALNSEETVRNAEANRKNETERVKLEVDAACQAAALHLIGEQREQLMQMDERVHRALAAVQSNGSLVHQRDKLFEADTEEWLANSRHTPSKPIPQALDDSLGVRATGPVSNTA